jgi:hypothetical protein
MGAMAEELSVQPTEVIEAEPVHPVPERSRSRALAPWKRDLTTAAIAVAGGAVAGAAAVAAVRAVRRPPKRPARRLLGKRRESVVASRSFLIDVHVLGR